MQQIDKRMAHWLHVGAREEGGANIIIILAICAAVLLILPFFLNSASLHITRRSSQNGADAAALAAGQYYVEQLSYNPDYPLPSQHRDYYKGQWLDGSDPLDESYCQPCGTGNAILWKQVYDRYIQRIYSVVKNSNEQRNYALIVAKDIARANRNEVIDSKFLVERCSSDCEDHSPFFALAVSVITQRGYVPAMPSYTEANGMPVRARASAEINLRPGRRGLIDPYSHECKRKEITPKGEIKLCLIYLQVTWETRLKTYQGADYPQD